MKPLAEQLNQIIKQQNANAEQMLSQVGRQLFFPKGILSQSAEAKVKAHRINATIGIAKEEGHTMYFDTVMASIEGIRPSQSLTYAPSFGIQELRKQWHEALYAKNPTLAGKSISLPVVTSGVTHGVSIFADVWVDPGDVVILPKLMWGNYQMILGVRKGARLSHYELFNEAGGYNLTDFEALIRKEAQANKKVIVLLNFPQNPTGYTLSKDEATEMVRILGQVAEAGTQVVAVMDDAYFGLFFEEETLKESLFAHLCDRHPNLLAVKLDGGTKEHFVWGLRLGFITYGIQCNGDAALLYEALEKKSAGAVRGNISNASHLGQTILSRSLKDPDNPSEKKEKFEVLKARALKVKAVLANSKYSDAWQAYPFNSGYFMCLGIKEVDAEALRVHLLDKYGVGLISLGKSALRVAFSCIDESQVEELFDIIYQGIQELKATQ